MRITNVFSFVFNYILTLFLPFLTNCWIWAIAATWKEDGIFSLEEKIIVILVLIIDIIIFYFVSHQRFVKLKKNEVVIGKSIVSQSDFSTSFFMGGNCPTIFIKYKVNGKNYWGYFPPLFCKAKKIYRMLESKALEPSLLKK